MIRSFLIEELVALKSYLVGVLIAAVFISLFLIASGMMFVGVARIMMQIPEFTAYESSMKLNGSSIEKRERYFTDMDMIAKVGEAYKQTYASGVVLSEYRVHTNRLTGQNWYPCEDLAARPRREKAFKCRDGWLRNGGKFSVASIRHGDKVVDVEVRALINNTSLAVYIPEPLWEEYVTFDGWEEYFDSMEPKNLFFTRNDYRPTPAEF